ncbi:hypothetical protein [Bradyrhizobium sp.]|uniref:hypothetical protein n=1 Tax=Bradyrhizobium sp. TaxID=376 RepID=UPI001EB7497D|nr:hypothetical protein [Bradyrhizobium sp.]MBV9985315.1 hypothetical protein [Bradyrhizobium sp.]
MSKVSSVHLVRVTTDNRKQQLWAAATTRENALTVVLNAAPEGWTPALLSDTLSPAEAEALNMKVGEVRRLTISHPEKPRGRLNQDQPRLTACPPSTDDPLTLLIHINGQRR